MAKNLEFEIDGYVSSYTRHFVKESLANAEKKAIICRVCSYGGSFFDGMQIMDQIAQHGDVTVDISGYAASAATLVGLGAKHTRISNNSFYLIHKVLSWVDAWGHLNEDQIATVIANLEKEKDENTKMTFTAAKAYAEKSGKSVADILDLMKKDIWLTADEAKEWGFVDEVYKASAKTNFKDANRFNMMGIPALPTNESEVSESDHEGEKLAEEVSEKTVSKLKTFINDIFKPKESKETQEPTPETEPVPVPDPSLESNPEKSNKTPKTKPMNKFGKINSVLGVDTLESTDKKGVYLNEESLQKINDILTEGEKHKADHDSVVAKMDLLHPDIKTAEGIEGKFTALQTKLANMPSAEPSGAIGDNLPVNDTETDWDTIKNLSHNKGN